MDILDTMRRILLAAALLPISTLGARDVVSTFPSGTEILRALGLGGRLAGVSRFCRQDGDVILPTVGRKRRLRPDRGVRPRRPVWVGGTRLKLCATETSPPSPDLRAHSTPEEEMRRIDALRRERADCVNLCTRSINF